MLVHSVLLSPLNPEYSTLDPAFHPSDQLLYWEVRHLCSRFIPESLLSRAVLQLLSCPLESISLDSNFPVP